MDINLFDYDLPKELIAHRPKKIRSQSKLLTLEKDTKNIEFCQNFSFIKKFFRCGDVLVFNNSKVFSARLECFRSSGARLECLLVECIDQEKDLWLAMIKKLQKISEGEKLFFPNTKDKIIVHCKDNQYATISGDRLKIKELIKLYGQTPLPPYIKRNPTRQDLFRYQTIYAKEEGSIAAPTAGLHFTIELMEELKNRGVIFAPITLHIGPGTFLPVKTKVIEDHKMHREHFFISKRSKEIIVRAKIEKRRIFAVGTTSVRALESAYCPLEFLKGGYASTDIFIYPPYRFHIVDALITNFHLPRSTLLMLVSAFVGIDSIKLAYQKAIEREMRFFSYGDAMLIL